MRQRRKKRVSIVRISGECSYCRPLNGSQGALAIIDEEDNGESCTPTVQYVDPWDLDQKDKMW